MENSQQPTLGRVIQILQELGFNLEPAQPGVLAYSHSPSGAELLFRARPHDSPARENELMNLRVQLARRGLLSEEELDSRLASHPEHLSVPQ